ncbi:Uncharacterised protein [uncultured archaeon]|nr:Uncharacterised protein [uncultured archaeon]
MLTEFAPVLKTITSVILMKKSTPPTVNLYNPEAELIGSVVALFPFASVIEKVA